MTSGADLLRVEGLRITFSVLGGEVQAVNNANFRILPGKVTALVGESGSGKSAISQAVMGILPNVAKVGGKILFNDPTTAAKPIDLLSLEREGEEIRALRGTRISKIFQEPMTSLSPLHTIGNQISEVLKIHTDAEKAERRARTEELLGYVGFANPKRAYDMYPFELSGGMRQRAMIAMAAICGPDLLIADEPTTALDATIQAQILDLLSGLRRQTGMAMVFISHDLGAVSAVCDRAAVMYAGRIVESNDIDSLFAAPAHPYTQGLFRAIPDLDAGRERLRPIEGTVPDPRALPAGCAFAPRCEGASALCHSYAPDLKDQKSGGAVACFHPVQPAFRHMTHEVTA